MYGHDISAKKHQRGMYKNIQCICKPVTITGNLNEFILPSQERQCLPSIQSVDPDRHAKNLSPKKEAKHKAELKDQLLLFITDIVTATYRIVLICSSAHICPTLNQEFNDIDKSANHIS